MNRNVYLKTVTLEAALQCFEDKTSQRFSETFEVIPVEDSFGRITAEPVFALCSNPNFNASAMDGIMVISERTHLADERNPIRLTLGVDFEYVDTGDVIVSPFDSVIMIENVLVIDENTVEIISPSHPWEHVRMVGEDFVIGEMILTRGHQITAVDLGAMISGGLVQIKVYSRLKVGLIPTGTEIVEIGTVLKPGDILESNSRMFSGLVLESGSIPNRYPIVPDDRELLKQALQKAVAENDIVIINAGSSAGRDDHTASLIAELGEVWVHGVDIKPGKPTILGAINQVPVIGIPGYPVSAYMTFKHFVVPMLVPTKRTLPHTQAVLSQAIPSSLKHKEFVRVQLGYVNEKLIATALKRGAASTMSLVKANGILTVEKESEGYTAGSTVTIEMTRNHLDPHQGLVSIGSHDLIMDWISDLMLKEKKATYLQSAHVGSMGGILALKRGEAHLAPIHLLDESTGVYNIKEVQKYLPNETWVLIKCIKRWQGFYMRQTDQMVSNFSDIVENQLTFVNRQNGSGTRLLTDHLLKAQNIPRTDIAGYANEVLTHTAVASAVLAGNADVGIGIQSVALQMGLAYQPLAQEDYDFLVPQRYLELQQIQDFIEILNSENFKSMLNAAGGYEWTPLTFVTIGVD